MLDVFIRASLHLLTQVRYWHWQTDSYPVHQALGAFYDGIDEAIDEIAETAMQDDGRVQVNVNGITPNAYEDLTGVEQIRETLHTYLEFVQETSEQVQDRTDLVNLLDDVKTLSSRTLYLLTLE